MTALPRRLVALLVAWAPLAGPASTAAQGLIDAVLAEVDGAVVTASDVALARALGLAGLAPSSAPVGPADVERLVDVRLVLAEADRLALTVEPETLQAAWAATMERMGGAERLGAWLAAAGVSAAWARRASDEQARVARFVEFRFRAFVVVTEEEVDGALEPGAGGEAARRSTRQRLVAAETDRRLEAWLAEARSRARIRRSLAADASVPCPLPMPDARR